MYHMPDHVIMLLQSDHKLQSPSQVIEKSISTILYYRQKRKEKIKHIWKQRILWDDELINFTCINGNTL